MKPPIMMGGLAWTPTSLLIKFKMVQGGRGARLDLQNTMSDEREEIEVNNLNNSKKNYTYKKLIIINK